MEFIRKLFDTGDFPARWECGNWTSFEGWLHVISDSLIFVAYAAIPASIAVFILRRRGHVFPGILWLFVAFILSCGITHLLDAVIFWRPIYRVSGVMKAVTALVSLSTAVVLILSLPRLLRLPLIEQENRSLSLDLQDRVEASAALEDTRIELESRAAQMTSKMRRYAQAMQSGRVVACQWTIGQDDFAWELGFAATARAADLPASCGPDWKSLLGAEGAAQLHRESRQPTPPDRCFEFECVLACRTDQFLRISASLDPEVADSPRSMSGVFRIIKGPIDPAAHRTV